MKKKEVITFIKALLKMIKGCYILDFQVSWDNEIKQIPSEDGWQAWGHSGKKDITIQISLKSKKKGQI